MNYTFALISLTACIISVVSAFYVLLFGSRDILSKRFIGFALAVAFYNLADFLTKISFNQSMAIAGETAANILWLLFVYLIYIFTLALIRIDKQAIFYKISWLVLLGNVLMSAVLLFTDFISGPPVLTNWGYVASQEAGYILFSGYSAMVVGLVLYLFWNSYRICKDKREKKQLHIIALGMSIGFSLGVIADIVVPFFGIYEVSFVPLSLAILISSLALAISRFGFLVLSPEEVADEVIETMPNFMFVVNKQGFIKIVNKMDVDRLGYQTNELVNRHVLEIIDEEDGHMVADYLADGANKVGAIKAYQTKLKRKNGDLIQVLLDATRIVDKNGDEAGCVFVFRDVSRELELINWQKETIAELDKTKQRMLSILEDTTEAKDSLAKALDDLQVVDRMKTEFLSVISHELRTPITPIKGFCQLFLSNKLGKLEPNQTKAIIIINKESEHLLSLIDNVLEISRLERGQAMELHKEPVLLHNTINELAEVYMTQAEEKKIKLAVKMPEKFPTVLMDEGKIRRAISNIFGNAIKFTPVGGQLEVMGQVGEREIKIIIKDNGIGLAQDQLSKVFDRFYQADSTYTRSVGGTGLGLAIVKQIIDSHGGKVWAESEGLGRGTSIIFTLPLA